MTYKPKPLDTSGVQLPPEIEKLTEKLAQNTHDIWARQRMAEGWSYGPQRDDGLKHSPCLVPYEQLSDAEKQYDRGTVLESLKMIVALGYQVAPPQTHRPDRYDKLMRQLRAAKEPSPSLHENVLPVTAGYSAQHELGALLAIWYGRRDEAAEWFVDAAPYRYLAERFLRLGVATLAREVTTVALEYQEFSPGNSSRFPWASDVALRLSLGLALARTGNPTAAQKILRQLLHELEQHGIAPQSDGEKHLWQETLGMLGRTYKDQAFAAANPTDQQALLKTSLEHYDRANQLTRGYWTGINVATLARLGGERDRARAVAEKVRAECLIALKQTRQEQAAGKKVDLYWELATLGESALVLEDLPEAERYYSEAYRTAPRRFGDLNSTRGHARRLLKFGGFDLALLDRWLPIPKVVVFSGHLLDQPGRPRERFPARYAHTVKQAIKDWLQQQHGLVGFSSAACGADILFQEALIELGGESNIVLPYGTEDFLKDCVQLGTPLENDEWSKRFQHISDAATRVIYASGTPLYQQNVSYDFANQMLLGLAKVRGAELDTPLLGLSVWDGRPGDGIGGTAGSVARWHQFGIPAYRVDLSVLPTHVTASIPVIKEQQPLIKVGSPARPVSPEDENTITALLFADAVGFSTLPDPQVRLFVIEYLDRIAHLVREYDASITVRETWGDGLFLAFDSVQAAGSFALRFAQLVNETDWQSLGFQHQVQVRIALHAGPIHRSIDPITGLPKCSGSHVSRAARLEPKTPPAQVYASEAFAALAAMEQVGDFTCEYVKQLNWAKHYGTFPTYVLRVRRS